MKLRKEVRIGFFAIIVIVVAWWGIKWLGGRNIFSSENTYYAYYDDVAGLQVSSRVFIRGVEVGNISDIDLSLDRVKVAINVKREFAGLIPENSVAVIASSGLMGGQQITIVQGDAGRVLADGGEIAAEVDAGLMGMLEQKAGALIDELEQTLSSLGGILGDNRQSIRDLLANLESATSTLDEMLRSQRSDIEGAIGDFKDFTGALAANTSRIDSMIGNLDDFTSELSQSHVVGELQKTVESLNAVVAAVGNAEGSVGKLIYDGRLYDSLEEASANLSALLADLKEHPMRYVHFSMFGSSEDKAARREARAAEKEAKRAAKQAARQ
ncbi:MAG: MCE family protein [Alistipes sp.]|nr:MCE family protein [Alistipes sp.]MDE6862611.1 MCE family protein [Alistipes sp.]